MSFEQVFPEAAKALSFYDASTRQFYYRGYLAVQVKSPKKVDDGGKRTQTAANLEHGEEEGIEREGKRRKTGEDEEGSGDSDMDIDEEFLYRAKKESATETSGSKQSGESIGDQGHAGGGDKGKGGDVVDGDGDSDEEDMDLDAA